MDENPIVANHTLCSEFIEKYPDVFKITAYVHVRVKSNGGFKDFWQVLPHAFAVNFRSFGWDDKLVPAPTLEEILNEIRAIRNFDYISVDYWSSGAVEVYVCTGEDSIIEHDNSSACDAALRLLMRLKEENE